MAAAAQPISVPFSVKGKTAIVTGAGSGKSLESNDHHHLRKVEQMIQQEST